MQQKLWMVILEANRILFYYKTVNILQWPCEIHYEHDPWFYYSSLVLWIYGIFSKIIVVSLQLQSNSFFLYHL